jgi:hypothetical protein
MRSRQRRIAWTGLGDRAPVYPDRQQSAEAAFDQQVASAARHHRHLWVVIVKHFASQQVLDALSGGPAGALILDSETIAGVPAVGCYLCAVNFDPALRDQRCQGELPRGWT